MCQSCSSTNLQSTRLPPPLLGHARVLLAPRVLGLLLELVCGFGRNAATGQERTLRHAPVQFLVPLTPVPRLPAAQQAPPTLPRVFPPTENGGRWAPPAWGGLGGGGRGGAARHGRQPSSAGRPQPEAGTSGRLRPPCPGAAGPSFPPGAAAAVLRGPAGRARPPRAGAGAAGRVGWRSASSRCILCRRPAPGSAAVGTFGTSLYRKGECLGAGSGAMPPLSGENWRTWRSLKRPWEQRHPLRERRSAGCPLTAGWLPSLLPSS